jgi:hypothetical protein
MAMATIIALAAIGASPAVSSFPFALVASAIALGFYHARRQPIPRILCGVVGALQMVLIFALGILLSFAAAASGAPFQDSLLNAADRAIGFDWSAYAHWVDRRPWLVLSYNLAYTSFLIQPLLLIVALSVAGQFRRLHLFTSAFTLCLMVTCLTFAFVPAVSVYAFLEVPLASFEHIRPVSTFQHITFIEQMRAGTLTLIDPFKGAGLITFPSFHACGAVLLTWGFWGVRHARVPALIVNLMMIAATPIDGAHYLVDVIAGVLLAFAGIAAVTALEPRAGVSVLSAVTRLRRRPEPLRSQGKPDAGEASPEPRRLAA